MYLLKRHSNIAACGLLQQLPTTRTATSLEGIFAPKNYRKNRDTVIKHNKFTLTNTSYAVIKWAKLRGATISIRHHQQILVQKAPKPAKLVMHNTVQMYLSIIW